MLQTILTTYLMCGFLYWVAYWLILRHTLVHATSHLMWLCAATITLSLSFLLWPFGIVADMLEMRRLTQIENRESHYHVD